MNRRVFLGSTAVLVACAHVHPANSSESEEEVTPAEDLMREHGVLRRIMYLYDEAAVRLDAARDVPLDALASAAAMVRRVIEDYHEKSEENYVFPRFEQAKQLADLTAILRRQHVTGRTLTDQIAALATGSDKPKLAETMRRFNHMYRAHAAREDTILFPAIRALVGKRAYAELGEKLEDDEKKILGEGGFEKAVVDVGKLEAAFGMDFASL